MLTIDGSKGEGGGQILRSSLALSLVTGKAFKIVKIRAGRPRPGLMRQHLTAVQAATRIGCASVAGARLGSTEVEFTPGPVQPGHYEFAVGSAGSAMLVVQTVLPALALAAGPSTLVVEGGTHNPHAPPFEFLERVFLPMLARMGPQVSARLERAGFFPAGGGKARFEIQPVARLSPLELLERGPVVAKRVTALVSGLPPSIGDREVEAAGARLGAGPEARRVVQVDRPRGPGNVVQAEIECESARELATSFGERGVRAEEVGRRAADAALGWLAADVPVGEHLADQLVSLMALAGRGAFLTSAPTEHTRSQIDVVGAFLGLEVEVRREPERDGAWRVEVGRRGR